MLGIKVSDFSSRLCIDIDRVVNWSTTIVVKTGL
jgi:hypothetical protein